MKNLIILFLSFISVSTFAQLTPKEAFDQMGRGINLGNTLEAPDEGEWAPRAQDYFFDDYKTAGFKTVRIPVRWYPHTQNAAPYKIDETWMTRVETVLDWALERDFYVIVNCHHSEPIKADYEGNKAKWDSIWVQVSERFKDKSEKLFFEMMNEPHGWTIPQTNDFNARTLDIIRKTNPTRIVLFSGNEWTASKDLISTSLITPEDNYLMGTYHNYGPWSFGGEGKGTWGTEADKNSVAADFARINNWSKAKDIPVLLGEFGSTYVNDDGGDSDLNSRFRHYACYVENALKYNVRFTVWDDNGWFQVYIRNSRKWKEWKDILAHYSLESTTNFTAKLQEDTTVLLNWKNQASIYDSITVERKNEGGSYKTIAKLNLGATDFVDKELTVGYDYYYRLITHQKDTAASFGYPQIVSIKPPPVRSFYNGKTISIPGMLQCEEYDKGGEGLSYHDTDSENKGKIFRTKEAVDIEARNDGGYQVAWIDSSEWFEFTVDITETGDYDIYAYVATEEEGASFRLLFEKGKTTTWTVPSTGSWQNTSTIQKTLRLPKGQQIMRVDVRKGPFNMDKILFQKKGAVGVANLEANQFSIYPNPSNGVININSKASQLKRIQIATLSGRIIIDRNLDNKTFYQINTQLSPGVYFVNAFVNNKRVTRKLIIK